MNTTEMVWEQIVFLPDIKETYAHSRGRTGSEAVGE